MDRNLHLELLCGRVPALSGVIPQVQAAARLCVEAFERGGTLFLCGNGGSRADAGHIAGELMKAFRNARPVPAGERQQLAAWFGADGVRLGERLQQGLRAVVLGADEALATAVCNDQDADLMFAQPLYALARPGDVLLALSTSGNARNVAMACRVARLKGMEVIGFTGQGGGVLATLATVCVQVPATETYLVQEYHLPLYHALCALVEDSFFPPAAAGH